MKISMIYPSTDIIEQIALKLVLDKKIFGVGIDN